MAALPNMATPVDGTDYQVLKSVPEVLDRPQTYHVSVLMVTAPLLAVQSEVGPAFARRGASNELASD